MNLGADDVYAFTPTLNSHTKFASQPSDSVSEHLSQGSNYSSNQSTEKVQNHQVGESQNPTSQTPADTSENPKPVTRELIRFLAPMIKLAGKTTQFRALCGRYFRYEFEVEELFRLVKELVGDQMIEMASREAQKSRKRKLAESSRLGNMERRQKQRVEEIRETQKKDKETLNMKEKLRAEVRMELKQLEMKSQDMGSLLRGLGVHVSGGLQHQIRAAYRKALLLFHPDRVPASDIHKLVQAEEKFKLISRMKEKFCPTL